MSAPLRSLGLAAAALALAFAVPALVQAQDDRFTTGATGSVSQTTNTQGTTGWSGEPGSSGDPSMMPDAIRAAAANFHNCLEGLWPAAARRGVSRRTFEVHT